MLTKHLMPGLILGMLALAMPVKEAEAQNIWKVDWSPDGTRIVFGVEPDIWIIDARGGIPVNLTDDVDDPCFSPVFSPDGEKVVYSVIRPIEDSAKGHGLYSEMAFTESIDPVTKETEILRENAYAASFSRDGHFMTYIRDWSGYAVYDIQSGQEGTYDFNGSDPPYFCGGHADMSPAGDHFVARFEYGNNSPLWNKYKLYSVSVETNEAEFISSGVNNCYYPRYSPDGNSLLFSRSGEGGSYQLVIYEFMSGEVQAVEQDAMLDTNCGCWSPDGTKICYVGNSGEHSGLYIYNLETLTSECIYSKAVNGVVDVAAAMPTSFSLEQNYPNPFNLSTTIPFVLDKPGHVRVDILTINGQRIRTLAERHMSCGVHAIVWNGRDDNGIVVSSGVYFCRLTMGEQVAGRQMMLTK